MNWSITELARYERGYSETEMMSAVRHVWHLSWERSDLRQKNLPFGWGSKLVQTCDTDVAAIEFS